VQDEELTLTAEVSLGTKKLLSRSIQASAQRPKNESRLQKDLEELFSIFGEAEVQAASLSFHGDVNWFVPKSLLKQLKKQVSEQLVPAMDAHTQRSMDQSNSSLDQERQRLEAVTAARYQIKIDRLEYLPTLQTFAAEHPDFVMDELVFEPKRAFLGKISAESAYAQLRAVATAMQAKLRLALPTVIRAWDEPLLRPWLRLFQGDNSQPGFEVGNPGALELLEDAGYRRQDCDLSSDFTLYALNTEAALSLAENNIKRVCLSVEDDLPSIRSKLRNWPTVATPQVILYKDTPLFIAEACSLTALHHGCPTASVCGYRTLEIENDEGERFFVAHESCKSIVYGKEAFSVSEHRSRLMELGVRDFRIDFLTRAYSAEALTEVLDGIRQGCKLPETHSANFERELL
jgi:putative protease